MSQKLGQFPISGHTDPSPHPLWAILGSHPMPTSCLKIAPFCPPSLPPHAYIKERQQQPPATPKITSTLCLPVTYKGDGISASKRARELILVSNGVEFNFQSTGAHYMCDGRIRAAHYQLKDHS